MTKYLTAFIITLFSLTCLSGCLGNLLFGGRAASCAYTIGVNGDSGKKVLVEYIDKKTSPNSRAHNITYKDSVVLPWSKNIYVVLPTKYDNYGYLKVTTDGNTKVTSFIGINEMFPIMQDTNEIYNYDSTTQNPYKNITFLQISGNYFKNNSNTIIRALNKINYPLMRTIKKGEKSKKIDMAEVVGSMYWESPYGSYYDSTANYDSTYQQAIK